MAAGVAERVVAHDVIVDHTDDLCSWRCGSNTARHADRSPSAQADQRAAEPVDVQQCAGFGLFIAATAPGALVAASSGDGVTREHLMDRGAVTAGQKLQLHRP